MLSDYLILLILLMLVLLGMLFTKLQWMGEKVSAFILNLIINVTIPSMLIYSINTDFTKAEFFRIIKLSYLPFLIMITMLILSFLTALLFKVPKTRRGTFMLSGSLQSILFFSIPVITSVLGTKYLPLALIGYLCQTLIYWSFGMYLFQKDHDYIFNIKSKHNLLANLKKVINLPLIAFAVALVLLLTNIKLPSFIDTFLEYNSNLTIPLAMFLIGNIIYSTGIKSLKLSKDTVLVVILRYVVSFLVVFLFCRLFHIESDLTKAFLLIFVCPAINTSIVLAKKYQIDYEFTTQAVIYTIIAYIVALPVVLLLLDYV